MTALAAPRYDTDNIGPFNFTFEGVAAASQTFYNGALSVANTSGLLIPAAATFGGRCAGVVDLGHLPSVTTATGQKLRLKVGVFHFKNSATTDEITQADFLKDCYVVDDQTVAKTDGGAGRPVAGQIYKVDGTKVYVLIGLRLPQDDPRQRFVASTTVTTGAIPVVAGSVLTKITVADTKAFTLADGVYSGQEKTIRCTGVSGTPVGTLTPAHPAADYATIGFDAAGESATLIWNGSAWDIKGVSGATPAA